MNPETPIPARAHSPVARGRSTFGGGRLEKIWPWLLVAALWVVALLNYLDRQVIFSIFPLLQTDLHASSLELAWTSTVFLITYGAVSPFAGYIADRFGRARIILASLMIWSMAALVTGHVHTIAGMLWSRGWMGVSEAFYIPAALALIVKVHGERSRSLATGIHQTGCYTGMIIGGAVGGLAGEKFGWRPIFGVLGIVGIAYAIILWAVLRIGRRRIAGGELARLNLAPLLHSRKLALFTGVFMAFSAATWILYTWLPLYLYDHFHMSLAAAGFEATFWLQTASYVGAFGGGFLADRSVSRFANGRIWVQMAGLALACVFLMVFSHTSVQLLVIIALVSVGIGRGCFDANTAPILTKLIGPELCSTGYGVLNCAGCLIGGAGALLGGWLRQRHDFSLVFGAAGWSLALAVLGLFLLTRELGRGRTGTGYMTAASTEGPQS